MARQQYIRERERQEKRSRATGVALTVSAHIAVITCCFFMGFTYLDPPPPEQEQILIDFTELESVEPEQIWNGTQPKVAEPDPTESIKLVQASEGPNEGTESNEAAESTVDDFGDVDIVEKPREKEINKKALFPTANNKAQKDTLAPQTAYEPSDELKAGHAQGNTSSGETAGEPNAKLTGRTVNGTLPRPSFGVQAEGVVVVEIWVDNYGQVQKAVAGAEGTNVTDKTLWQAARKAALGAHFNMSADAPALQKGTITYIFKITR